MLPLRRHERGTAGSREPMRVPLVLGVALLCVLGVVAVAVGAVGVYRQPPPVLVAAETASPGSLVAARVVSATDQMSVEMPDVVGMRCDHAEVVLEAAGLSFVVRSVASTESESTDGLIVDSQSPSPGVLISTEESVTISLEVPQGRSAKKPARYVVCIDPGHQARGDSTPEPIGPGSDRTRPSVMSGVTGSVTRLPEYEVALQISMNLKARLEARGIKVVMTRMTNDVSLSNSARAKIANKAGADLLVRVHCDGSPDESVAGISTLYPSSSRWTRSFAAPSRSAARTVQRAIVRNTGAVDRGTQARGDLSGFNWSKVPCVLVECGFLSNPVEDRLLASPHYQDKLATGIADGVIAHLRERGK